MIDPVTTANAPIGLLLFHQGGGTGPGFVRKLETSPWPIARIERALGRRILVRAPTCEGIDLYRGRRQRAWTWPGKVSGAERTALYSDDRDVQIARAALADLRSEGCERVLGLGQSAGAVFVWWALTHPYVARLPVDAWAPCSFPLPDYWIGPDDDQPIYHEMGTLDRYGDVSTAVEHLTLRGGPGAEVDLDPTAARVLAREYGDSIVVRCFGRGHPIRLTESHSTHHAALRWLVQRRGW